MAAECMQRASMSIAGGSIPAPATSIHPAVLHQPALLHFWGIVGKAWCPLRLHLPIAPTLRCGVVGAVPGWRLLVRHLAVRPERAWPADPPFHLGSWAQPALAFLPITPSKCNGPPPCVMRNATAPPVLEPVGLSPRAVRLLLVAAGHMPSLARLMSWRSLRLVLEAGRLPVQAGS